jgi:hypothetical protein
MTERMSESMFLAWCSLNRIPSERPVRPELTALRADGAP